MSNFQISVMTEKDIPELQQLWHLVKFEKTYSDQFQEIKKMILRNPRLCLCLKDLNSNRLVGAVLGGFDGRRGWIHHLAIHPEYQKKGFGLRLMKKLTREFEMMGVAKLKLEIVESNHSVITFYEKLGWQTRPELTTMSLTLKTIKKRKYS